MGYSILGEFEESAQEPTVRFNIQPATQPKRVRRFSINKANSSSRSAVAKVKLKVNVTLEKPTKAQRESRVIALLFL